MFVHRKWILELLNGASPDMSSSAQNVAHVDTKDPILRVVQLTDTHLCQVNGGTLLGMDTDHSLQAIIDLVQSERPAPDIVLGTGDLADGGARDASGVENLSRHDLAPAQLGSPPDRLRAAVAEVVEDDHAPAALEQLDVAPVHQPGVVAVVAGGEHDRVR